MTGVWVEINSTVLVDRKTPPSPEKKLQRRSEFVGFNAGLLISNPGWLMLPDGYYWLQVDLKSFVQVVQWPLWVHLLGLVGMTDLIMAT